MAEVPCSSLDDPEESFLDGELQALQSIYINEIDVSKEPETKSTTVSIVLHPATADNIDQQFVRMTLKLTLLEEYPDVLPVINIRNPRGLSDEKLKSISEDLSLIAENKKGNSMLFEMIEAAKEHLTSQNRPSGECAICLYGFSDSDVFTKTECYHYFHSHCLARYAKNHFENTKIADGDDSEGPESELLCPMCRIPIQFSATEESYPPPNSNTDESWAINEEILELQKKMSDLFQKQLEKGGIIDVEAEKNKYLIEISNVETRSDLAEKSNAKNIDEVTVEVTVKTEENDFVHKDKTKSGNERSPKSESRHNGFYENDRRKKFDTRYKSSDNFHRRNHDRRNKELHQSDKISNPTLPEEKDSLDASPDSISRYEDETRKKSFPQNYQRPKYPNSSSGKFSGNQRYSGYNQRGRYSRPSYHTNEGYDYSYNSNRRSNVPNKRFDFRDQNSYQYRERELPEDSYERESLNGTNIAGDFKGRRNNEPRGRGYKSHRKFESYNRNSTEKYSTQSSNVKQYSNEDGVAADYQADCRKNSDCETSGYKADFESDRTDDSCKNSTDKPSRRVDSSKGQYARKFNSRRDSQNGENAHANLNGRDCAHEASEETPINIAVENKPFQRRNKNYSHYRSRQAHYDETDPRDMSNAGRRGTHYQKNNQSHYQYGRQSPRNTGTRDYYGSRNWKSKGCREKSTEIEKGCESESKEIKSVPDELPKCEKSSSLVPSQISPENESLFVVNESISRESSAVLRPPPGFANPSKKVFYGLQAANPPPGFRKS